MLRRLRRVLNVLQNLEPAPKEALLELVKAVVPILDGQPPTPQEKEALLEALLDLKEALSTK